MNDCDKCNRDAHPCWQCGAPIGHSEFFCSARCEKRYDAELAAS